MHILAISGSLRVASSNTTLLRAATALAPAGTHITLYDGLGGLPHFNPDLDRALDDPRLPPRVQALRAQVEAADAILISSPEYAHGVPGSLKNALDWLVGGSEVVDKPVALINTSPHSKHAQASLAETLGTMAAPPVAGSPFMAPLVGKSLDAAGAAADPEVAHVIQSAFAALAGAVEDRR